MENIISLLHDKNYHLQRFHDLNEIELMNFAEGNFDNLESFYNTRESILDLIRCIDRVIEQSHMMMEEPLKITNDEKLTVTRALAQKNDLVTRILAQDLQILSVMESAKSHIIKELAQVKSARKAVGAYKSASPDPRLDEEA